MPKKTVKTVRINPRAALPETLKKELEKHGGKEIYLYDEPTHGCITHGVAVTFSREPGSIFFEAPKEALIF